jgi:competence protein ComGF
MKSSSSSSNSEQVEPFKDNPNALQERNISINLNKENEEVSEESEESYFESDSDESENSRFEEEFKPTMKEKYLEEKKRKGKWIIKHNSHFRLRWDLFIMLLAIYNCISIPFNAAFAPEANVYYDIFDICTDFLFFLDIIINFRTSYVHFKTGLEIYDAKSIARNYFFSSRFWIDLLASIPLERIYILINSNSNTSTLQLLGLLKLVRLLRLGRVIRYMKFKTGLKIGIRIVQLLFFLLLIVHWIGWIWFLLIKEKDSWMPPKDLDAQQTDFYEEGMITQYTIVFYYAILTMVGNELAPRNNIQTVFATFVVISGALLSAFIFGNIAALMATMNRRTNYFDQILDLSSLTMKSIRLPLEMQNDVYSYLLTIQDTPYLQQDIERFFSILSDPLKKQINAQLYLPMLKKITLLKHADSTEYAFFLSHLNLWLFLPNELIIREDMHGDQMYFISNGSVEWFITHINGEKKEIQRLRILKQNEYFGEVALVTWLKRSASVKAIDFVYCMKLERKDYNILEENFPHLVDEMKKRVREFTDSKMIFRRQAMANIPWLRFIGKLLNYSF